MHKNKKNILKNILMFLFIGVVTLGSIAGITFASFNIAQKTKLSSDFDSGVSYSLKFNLVDKNNEPLYTTNGDGSYEIENKSEVLDKLKNTADKVAIQLQDMGLTNISISSGIGSYTYAVQTEAASVTIPIGYVNMSFENASKIFDFNENDNNAFLNENKVVNKIGDPNRYSFEVIKSEYTPYASSGIPSTGRNWRSSILANEKGQEINSDGQLGEATDYFLVSSPENIDKKIQVYENPDGSKDESAIQLVQPNHYFIGPFIKDKFDYDQIQVEESNSTRSTVRADESTGEGGEDDSTDEPSTPDQKKQYQTHATWFLWTNKSGLINYINRLILASYYNLYANNIVSSNNINVGTPKYDYLTNTNGIDTTLRKEINTYLDSLSDLEKSIIQFVTDVGDNQPDFVNENTLMGFLYEYYNSGYCSSNSVGLPEIGSSNDQPIDSNIHSQSEIDGWSFLESDNSDLSNLLSPYLVAKFDYTNFSNFFQNPTPPDENDDDSEQDDSKDEPNYYTTNKFKLNNQGSSIDSFIDSIQNEQYDFPFLDVADFNYIDAFTDAFRAKDAIELKVVESEDTPSEIFNSEWYKEDVAKVASVFSSQKLFGDIAITRQRYVNPANCDFPIFNVLLIVLSAIILIVGIIVSILYRVPGFLSFLFSALTFTGALSFFNLFGFTFSFFSFIGLLFGTCLSFLTPFYIFRNFRKEINEGSSIYGAYFKTIKKYWKLALDTHVVSLLVGFTFLFFSKNQLIDFGALLTLSTFISAVLSGILFFVSIMFLVSTLGSSWPKLFLTKKLFVNMGQVTTLGEGAIIEPVKQMWYVKKLSNYNFFSKIRFIITMVLVAVALVGLILLLALGPGSSVDFANGYVLRIMNYDLISSATNFNLNNIPGYVGSGSYIYENVLYVPVTGINNESVLTWLQSLIYPEGEEWFNPSIAIINSTSITEYSSLIPLQTVKSAMKCFGISLAFIACWTLISINWAAIIPMVFVQLSIFLLSIGWIGITRVPFNIEAVIVVSMIYLLTSVYAIGILSSIKTSWDRKKTLSFDELKKLVNSIVAKVNLNYIHFVITIIVFALLSAILTANILLAISFAIMIINLLIVLLTLPYLLMPAWFVSIKLKNIYVKELVQSSQNKMMDISLNYDSVDEQLVKGININ